MPTYEYLCKSCGESIEVFQSFSERPLKTHKECGGDLQKVFHARGIVFKGNGFYATDSKSASSTKSGTDTGADTSKPGSKAKSEKASAKAGTSSSSDND